MLFIIMISLDFRILRFQSYKSHSAISSQLLMATFQSSWSSNSNQASCLQCSCKPLVIVRLWNLGYKSQKTCWHLKATTSAASEGSLTANGKTAARMQVSSLRQKPPWEQIKHQLRWSGHCVWMTNERLHKKVVYSQLSKGQRTPGGQRKTL